MPNYSTDLKTWGSTGEEFPNNYSYVEGEQPVDAWDNYFNHEVVNDIEHLIDVTNNELLARDGTVALQADLSDDQGNTIWDYSAQQVPSTSVEQNDITVNANDGLSGGGTVSTSGGSVGLSIDVSDFAGDYLADDGSENLTLSTTSGDIDLSSPATDIRIASGKSIRDGGNTIRVQFEDTQTSLWSPDETRRLVTYDTLLRLSAFDSESVQIYDELNGREMAKFDTTNGGVLHLTNADLEVPNGTITENGAEVATSTSVEERARAYNFVMN